MTTYYLATSRGDDMTQWVYMFETPTQANKFVRDVAERKLPDHPAYVGLHWDIMPITLHLPKQALGDFLMLEPLEEQS